MPLSAFVSPKGGVGKTTLAANVAEALRRQGRPVLALDLDPQNALRLHFGVPIADTAGFMAELARRPDWRGFVRATGSGVRLLPHGALDLRGALEQSVTLEREPELLALPLREMLADPQLMVVADLPPGPSCALAVLAPLASLIITVLQSEVISAAVLGEVESGRFLAGATMAALAAGRLHFVLNGVDLQSRLSRTAAEALARHLGPRLLGAISRDDTLGEALSQLRLVQEQDPNCAAAGDIRHLAQAIEALVAPAAESAAPLAALTRARGAR